MSILIEPGKSLNADEIQSLYNYFDKCPVELLELYKDSNGGIPENPCFFDKNGYECEIDMLLAFKYRQAEFDLTIEEATNVLINNWGVSNNMIAFAINSGGDYYCLNKDDNSVILCLHDDEPMIRNTGFSISEFLEQMNS